MTHSADYLDKVIAIAKQIPAEELENLANEILNLREREGRLFILGVGGSAGNASHAVNDFRKLCHVETYAPTDNVSELTARTNDEGWETIFSEWLIGSRMNEKDGILVFSVGGGDAERNISANIVKAVDLAKERGAKVMGIVGRKEGHTAKNGDAVIVIPTVDAEMVTPLSESYQAVLWHCLVSHPALKAMPTKWERSVN